MGIKTETVVTCDRVACGERIIYGGTYVDAMTYGAVFHTRCYEALTGPELAKLLGLDDIKWRRVGIDEPDLGKVIYGPPGSPKVMRGG